MRYAAFLRGINVGGSTLKMTDLQKDMESLGFSSVKTVLASGNVVFDTKEKDASAISKKIASVLQKRLNREISVNLRTMDSLKELYDMNPFKKIKLTPTTKMCITFLPASANKGASVKNLKQDKFIVLSASKRAVCTYFELQKGFGTLELMYALEKEFGKNITTRTLDTIRKTISA